MSKLFPGLLAVAASVAVFGFAMAPASAMPAAKAIAGQTSGVAGSVEQVGWRGGGHRGGFHRGGHWRGGHGGFHHRGFRGTRLFIAPAYGYGYGNGYGGGGCQWLKRRALNSGSRYWWSRYNDCRWG